MERELEQARRDMERFKGGGMLDVHGICDERDALKEELASSSKVGREMREQLEAMREELARANDDLEWMKDSDARAQQACQEMAVLLGVDKWRDPLDFVPRIRQLVDLVEKGRP